MRTQQGTPFVVTYNTRGRGAQWRVLEKIDFNHRVVVPIHDIDGDMSVPVFDLTFYGIPIDEFYIVPGGADPIFAALKRRGLDVDRYRPLSMFDVRRSDNVYKQPA